MPQLSRVRETQRKSYSKISTRTNESKKRLLPDLVVEKVLVCSICGKRMGVVAVASSIDGVIGLLSASGHTSKGIGNICQDCRKKSHDHGKNNSNENKQASGLENLPVVIIDFNDAIFKNTGICFSSITMKETMVKNCDGESFRLFIVRAPGKMVIRLESIGVDVEDFEIEPLDKKSMNFLLSSKKNNLRFILKIKFELI
jgi:hypothetical protein